MFIQQDDPDTVTLWVDLCNCLDYSLAEWKEAEGEYHTLTIASEDGTAKFFGFTLWELQELRYCLDRYIGRIEKQRNTTDLFEKAARAYHQQCVQQGFSPQEPSSHLSRVNPNTGRVHLRNVNGHLATYRWDGKRLVRCDSGRRRSWARWSRSAGSGTTPTTR